MEANVHALKTRAPGSPALARYEEVAQILTGVPTASFVDGVTWVQDLCAIFEIPPLSVYDLKEKDFSDVVAKVRKASSTKGNPIMLTDNELTQILEKAHLPL
jgi:alcohol dehydrogenase class IV